MEIYTWMHSPVKKLTTFKRTRRPWATSLTWEMVPINKHISTKLWLYHDIDKEKKKIIFSFWESFTPLFVKTYVLSPKNSLCKVWLKLAQWFWRRWFHKFINVFSLFHYYLPLEKDKPFIWTRGQQALSVMKFTILVEPSLVIITSYLVCLIYAWE